MVPYCLFRLYAPMASYGSIAVGEDRHSYSRPTKSAVLGLIAGSLGIRRDEEEIHLNLANNLGFSVIVEHTGVPVRDYHTVQSAPRKLSYFHTRKDELDIGRNSLSAIVTRRDYLCDQLACICLWNRNANPVYSLEDIVQAITNPVFVPYLGRKSCPVSLPIRPRIIEADSIKEAYYRFGFSEKELFKPITTYDNSIKFRIFWDCDGHSGVEPDEQRVMKDEIMSRKRWQFFDRNEFLGRIACPGSEGTCISHELP